MRAIQLKSSGSAVLTDEYRFHLTRVWDEPVGLLTWLMFNPGAADHVVADRTLDLVIEITRAKRYGGVQLVNLFPLRCPPQKVRSRWEALPEEEKRLLMDTNDYHIEHSLSRSALLRDTLNKSEDSRSGRSSPP